jgi:hypothetical protein
MKFIGVALLVVGIVGLFYGGIGYSRQTTLLDVDGLKATTTEHKTIPIAPVAGGVAALAGLGMLLAPRFRRA